MNNLPFDLIKDMEAFITTDDRFGYIRMWLRRFGIEGKKIETKGLRHLLVRFKQPYSAHTKVKTLVAHYDRVPGTPGANDNSAAVFQLLCHAARLAAAPGHGNTQILFTDGEELTDGALSNQGSYQLAALFRSFGIQNCRFYIFDLCGIGDCIAIGGASSVILKQALQEGRIQEGFYKEAVEELALGAELVRGFQGRSADWIYALFSDDLGFLLNGYPAVFFSVLPTAEAALAHGRWKEVFNDAEALKSLGKGYLNPEFQAIMRPLLPASWLSMHTKDDTTAHLERRAFALMEDFLNFITYGSL
jgi:hypothetical protein